MQRRNFLAGTAAATALSRRAAAAKTNPRVLRYVPQADLTVIDPVLTTAYITRYHATMVWDQLYGIDSTLQPRPQMVEGHTTEDDGRLWTFTLRHNLRFTDGEPVRGRDCIASIKRWAARDPMGQALLARVADMTAPDDRRFTIRLVRPFSLVLNCLAKIGPPALMVMPKRFADTDPFQSIKEVVGSGPFRFMAAERVVGSKVVYTRNADYVPRPNGTPDWLAGPKIVNFDRVEWTVMPDPATAAAALQNDEVDWWENPPNDLLPMLDRSTSVRTEANGPLGYHGDGGVQPSVSAVRQARGPAGDAAGDVANRLDDRSGRHRSQAMARRHRHFHPEHADGEQRRHGGHHRSEARSRRPGKSAARRRLSGGADHSHVRE